MLQFPHPLLKLDEFILDHIFQPVADRLHQWWGVTPQDICEFFAIGAVIAKLVYLYLTYPAVMSAETGLLLGSNVLVMAVLVLWIVWPRDAGTSTTLNIKRLRLIMFRFFWFSFLFFDLTKFGIYLRLAEYSLIEWWGDLASYICTVLTWCGFCFASLNRPPPRKVRERKWLAWLRPRFAT